MTGSVRFSGAEIGGLKTYAVARKGLGYVPENRDIFPTLTVRQNLLLGMKGRAARRAAGAWTTCTSCFPVLEERADAPAGVMSGGEQQMLTLCRTLMGDPELVMIDEPTEGLAPKIVEQVARLFEEIKNRGVSILLVEQKLTIALKISPAALRHGPRPDRVRGHARRPARQRGRAQGVAGSLNPVHREGREGREGRKGCAWN